MDIEIAKEIIVLSRRLHLLLRGTSDHADKVFDQGSEEEIEAFQDELFREYADVLDREAFLSALQKAYEEEGLPEMINS